jgi:hypothetical protein
MADTLPIECPQCAELNNYNLSVDDEPVAKSEHAKIGNVLVELWKCTRCNATFAVTVLDEGGEWLFVPSTDEQQSEE